ncbi:uncharacterized protein TNCV_1810571 [Trichonephila clavipes]|nr:uncharacterized protein TNCV_1810571 [Trichonephila clavipes]
MLFTLTDKVLLQRKKAPVDFRSLNPVLMCSTTRRSWCDVEISARKPCCWGMRMSVLTCPYESILEPQLIRAHWRIIRKSSSPLVSSQTSRCPTHAPTAKPLQPTVVVLPPLITIRHCVCKATVSCLGSDLVQSSPGYCMSSRTGTKVQTLNKR